MDLLKKMCGSDTCVEKWQIIVKGAGERQSEADAAAGKAEDSSRTPWPCIHVLPQEAAVLLQ